jgi:predicted double-glycine peptidase
MPFELVRNKNKRDINRSRTNTKVILENPSNQRYRFKRTGTKFALNTIETETETHVNHPVLSPTVSATEDRTLLTEGG